MAQTPEKFWFYLSASDDKALVAELQANPARGRKSQLLRNMAVHGFQHATRLANEIKDVEALTTALACAFGTPAMPDYRAAAEFLRMHNAKGGAKPANPAPERQAAPQHSAQQEAEDSSPAEPESGPRKPGNWGGLGGLVRGSKSSGDAS